MAVQQLDSGELARKVMMMTGGVGEDVFKLCGRLWGYRHREWGERWQSVEWVLREGSSSSTRASSRARSWTDMMMTAGACNARRGRGRVQAVRQAVTMG
jgi:hypothetical protein